MRLPLDKIRIDGGTQVRAEISEEVVTHYAERMGAGDVFPPVALFHDGNHYYIGDGFHRCLASQRLGLAEIDADVRAGTKADALWFALGANRKNAHQMTPRDKRHAIVLALETWPDKSQNQIAEQIGCDQGWVSKIKAEVMTTHTLPDRVTGKDGKSYPATRRSEPQPESLPRRENEPVAVMEREPPARRQVYGPPSNGLQFARIAIMKLEEITDTDTERQLAFTLVRRWLDAR